MLHPGVGPKLRDGSADPTRPGPLGATALAPGPAFAQEKVSHRVIADHLRASAEAIHAEKPGLSVLAVCADYTQPFDLPSAPGGGMRLGFFPGSTIGNLRPDEAIAFLETWARKLGPGSAMVVGVDLRKDAAILEPAYDDAQGVTAEFSKNLLVRANH